MADQNDISDIRPDGAGNTDTSPLTLPIRGEKRIIPSAVSPTVLDDIFETQYTASGQLPPSQKGYAATGRLALVEQSDFDITAALKPFVDYVLVRLPHRGASPAGSPDGNAPPAIYRFLINPSQLAVARTTLDGQAMTRAGWQIGVWGEDSLQITLNGKTPGMYFAFGLTDRYESFTKSYRNFAQLQVVFENNGYWFEGEQANEGPLAAGFTRRRIKMHEDVELIVGNFMWYGMFDSLTISQNADSPFLLDFNLVFVAWKERFRKGSPYQNTIQNDTKRGHSYGAWASSALASQNGVPSNASAPITPPSQQDVSPVQATPQGGLVSPAAQNFMLANTLPHVDTTTQDFSPDPTRTDFLNIGNFFPK